jgi:hypothetical protein
VTREKYSDKAQLRKGIFMGNLEDVVTLSVCLMINNEREK